MSSMDSDKDAPGETPSRWLFIPMEIVERELYGNISLALEAVRQGWRCVIGTKRAIFDAIEHLPRGVILLKSITTGELERLKYLNSTGHRLACLDVEGLVYTSMEEFVTVRFSSEPAIKETDLLMFWGEIQRDAVAKAYPAYADRMKVTGSQTSDMWRPESRAFYQEQVDMLKERFGRYILIPSSFGTANHYMGDRGNMDIMQRDKMVPAEKHDEFYKFWVAYEDHVKRIFREFQKFLPELSKAFPDHTIIVRPHPSESHETWKAAAKDLPNVVVIFEGVVSPWLLAAEAILHWGCTTGLEAYLMGRPVVAYNPATEEEDRKYEHKLPHSISIITRTPEETIRALARVIENPDDVLNDYPHVAAGDKNLKRWLAEPKRGTAAAEIMAELDKLPLKDAVWKPLPPTEFSAKDFAWKVFDYASRIPVLEKLLPAKIRHGVETRAYGRHKTRDIDFDHLQESFQRMQSLRGTQGARMSRLAKNMYLFERAGRP